MTIHPNLQKFRPVLTLSQIKHIAHLCGQDCKSAMNDSIIKVLVPVIAKIEVGAINPAYKLSEIHAQKLQEKSERDRYENNLMSPEEELEYERKILGI